MTPAVLVVTLRPICTRLALVRTLLVGALLVRAWRVGTLLLRAIVAHVGLLRVVSALFALRWVGAAGAAAVLALALRWVLAVVGGLGRLGAGVVGWWGIGRLAGHGGDGCGCLGE